MASTSLQGTVAFVTGASSGIGEATARALAAEGAAIAAVARRRDRLETLVRELTAAGGRAIAIEADVSIEAQARNAVDHAVRELGRLDTLVNNAGVMLLGPIADAPVEEWDRMLAINVNGLMYCTHAALPHLLATAGTHGVANVVNISSVAGRVARVGAGVYNATKFAVGAFSESLRQEVTKRHVRVCLIEPGATKSELISHNRPEIREQFQSGGGGITQFMEAEDIADAIRYVVTRPPHVAINEVLIRPTEQER